MTPEYIAYLPAIIIIAALAIVTALGILAERRKTAPRAAVVAECLVCAYMTTGEDVRAATAAGNAHGDDTGHPLILRWPV